MKKYLGKISVISVIIFLISTAAILGKPLFYRLYPGDRIKGEIRITVDGETVSLKDSDFSGCDKVKIKPDNTAEISVRADTYGKYAVIMSSNETDPVIHLYFHQFNWWNVYKFNLSVDVDITAGTVTYEGSYTSLKEDGNKNLYQLSGREYLSSKPISLYFN